jgi:hypothetical protein
MMFGSSAITVGQRQVCSGQNRRQHHHQRNRSREAYQMLSEKDADWGIIYDALIHAIKTNSGIGFHNNDQGHLAYMTGAENGSEDMGDTREENRLYQMLVRLSDRYGKSSGVQVRNWREFCQLAQDGYCEAKGINRTS